MGAWDKSSTAPTVYWEGAVDDIVMLDIALDTNQVKRLYAEGTNNDLITSIDEATSVGSSFINGVQIYPNPADDYINILSPSKVMSIKIYAANGKEMLVEDGQGKNQVDISSLKKGLYLLRVITESNGSQSFRVIKN